MSELCRTVKGDVWVGGSDRDREEGAAAVFVAIAGALSGYGRRGGGQTAAAHCLI